MLVKSASAGGHKLEYNAVTAVFLVELFKFVWSGYMWDKKSGAEELSVKSVLAYSVPALLYAISNSLNLYALSYLNPVVFYTVQSLKIVSTSVCSGTMLGKKFSSVQWCAILLLVVCTVLTRIKDWMVQDSNEAGIVNVGFFLCVTHHR